MTKRTWMHIARNLAVGAVLLGVVSTVAGNASAFTLVLMVVNVANAAFWTHRLHQTRPQPEREVTNWPRVAELEHDTGIFDLYVRLGAEGHSEGVGDACRRCTREKIAKQPKRWTSCGRCKGRVPIPDDVSGWHEAICPRCFERVMLPVPEPDIQPPHGGFNTPCTCDECLPPSTFAVPLDAPLDTFAQLGLTTEQATVCTHPAEARFLSPTGPACGRCGASTRIQQPCAHPLSAMYPVYRRATGETEVRCRLCGGVRADLRVAEPKLRDCRPEERRVLPLSSRTRTKTAPSLRLLSLRSTNDGGWKIDDACIGCGKETVAFMVVRPEPGDVVSFTCRNCLTYNKVTYER